MTNEQTQTATAKTKPLTSLNENTKPIEEMPFEETLEAILFAAGHAMSYETLAQTFHIPPKKLKEKVMNFAEQYNSSAMPRGVLLLTYDEACQLCTKEQYMPYIREALGIRQNGNLSASSIETLAIIAYNQPVTRAYVDTVRSVDSSYAISNLLDRGLIETKGRLEAPGRPMLFGTSAGFLRCFGLSSLSELPGVSSEEAAELLARMQEQNSEFDKNQLTIEDTEDLDDKPSEETEELSF